MIPLLWLVAGVVLVVAEVVSGEFVLVMLGTAALVTAGVSALGAPLGVDAAVFAVASAALVLLARPALKRRVAVPDPVDTGPRALLGTRGEVVEAVDAAHGTVKLGGSLWSARAVHDGITLAPGAPVLVVDIQGAVAVVSGEEPS